MNHLISTEVIPVSFEQLIPLSARRLESLGPKGWESRQAIGLSVELRVMNA